MNIGALKDSANGGAQAAASIPSLKRTLSGGASGSVSGHGHSGGGHPGMGSHGHGGVHGVHGPSMGSHLGVGMNSIPSVLHATPNTNPPQMLRAVTSSGVLNRPVSSQNSFRGPVSSSMNAGVGGPSAGMAPATTRSVSQSTNSMQDWRMYLTIEERQAVRSKIRDAYTSRCSTYEDLLQVVRRVCVCYVSNGIFPAVGTTT